jgi:hypothetical protein
MKWLEFSGNSDHARFPLNDEQSNQDIFRIGGNREEINR